MISNELIRERVQSSIRVNLINDPVSALVNECKTHFSGEFSEFLGEAVSPTAARDLEKMKYSFLENGELRWMFASNGAKFEAMHMGDSISFKNEREMKAKIDELKKAGYRTVKNKGAIVKFLTKSVRFIATYIRKYGLVTLIGVALAAALIAFVGTSMIPMLATMGMKMGIPAVGDVITDIKSIDLDFVKFGATEASLGDRISDAATSVKAAAMDGVDAIQGKIEAVVGSVKLSMQQLIQSTTPTVPAPSFLKLDELDKAITTYRDIILNPDTASSTRNELATMVSRFVAERDSLATLAAAEQAATEVVMGEKASLLDRGIEIYRNIVLDPNTSPEERLSMSKIANMLVKQRKELMN